MPLVFAYSYAHAVLGYELGIQHEGIFCFYANVRTELGMLRQQTSHVWVWYLLNLWFPTVKTE
jgi:hypothetical protein